MSKIIRLEPIGRETSVRTNSRLLSVLQENNLDILSECRGRGLCATCHIYVKEGAEALSPIHRKEQRTLELITTAACNSRLACQARILADGLVVELPKGMYISAIQNIDDLIGRRAEDHILHPITGTVMVEAGKLITRSMISQLQDEQISAMNLINRIQEA